MHQHTKAGLFLTTLLHQCGIRIIRLEPLQMRRKAAPPSLQTAGVPNPFSKQSSKIYNYELCREGDGEQTIRLVYGTTLSRIPTQALPAWQRM